VNPSIDYVKTILANQSMLNQFYSVVDCQKDSALAIARQQSKNLAYVSSAKNGLGNTYAKPNGIIATLSLL
jgi:hypothetical protein